VDTDPLEGKNGSEKRIVQVITCHPEVRSAAEGTMKRYFIEQIIA
jgi:hypothetical protein